MVWHWVTVQHTLHSKCGEQDCARTTRGAIANNAIRPLAMTAKAASRIFRVVFMNSPPIKFENEPVTLRKAKPSCRIKGNRYTSFPLFQIGESQKILYTFRPRYPVGSSRRPLANVRHFPV